MEIEKGVPIPDVKRRHFRRYRFGELAIGDCLKIPVRGPRDMKRARQAASAYGKRNDVAFVCQADSEAKLLRVWRSR